MKQCPACNRRLPPSEFTRDRLKHDGLRYRCKKCDTAYRRKWLASNPERKARYNEYSRSYHLEHRERRLKQMREWKRRNPLRVKLANDLRHRQGLTPDEYRELIAAQEGQCAICGDRPSASKSLAVDHCHETGIIRGALCDRCNLGLGLLRDNPEILRAAAHYVETPPTLAPGGHGPIGQLTLESTSLNEVEPG